MFSKCSVSVHSCNSNAVLTATFEQSQQEIVFTQNVGMLVFVNEKKTFSFQQAKCEVQEDDYYLPSVLVEISGIPQLLYVMRFE